jgi:hypothetical protein
MRLGQNARGAGRGLGQKGDSKPTSLFAKIGGSVIRCTHSGIVKKLLNTNQLSGQMLSLQKLNQTIGQFQENQTKPKTAVSDLSHTKLKQQDLLLHTPKADAIHYLAPFQLSAIQQPLKQGS